MSAAQNQRNCYCRPGESSCGKCEICGRSGHASHFPGPLPYTGAWCDEHFARLQQLMDAGRDEAAQFGIRDAQREHFTARARPRGLLRRRDTLWMEFRSQWLCRVLAVDRHGRIRWRSQRYNLAMGNWTRPLEQLRGADWVAASAADFERLWARAV